jgi:hypothetical protein
MKVMVTAKILAGTLILYWKFKMTEEKINIVDLTRVTAKNMYEMLMELSTHIEKLQAENAELKRKLELHQDDLK